MIKTLTAYTNEIDDIDVAVREIADQVNYKAGLCAHSVGIIACHYEFIYSGVVKAVCDLLPFDIVGTVSPAQAVSGTSGSCLLTLTVFTSDEVSFITQLTPCLTTEPGDAIEETYIKASAHKKEAPALILTFAPLLVNNSGDEYVDVFTKISGGVPCFGTISIDDTDTFDHSFLIFNGEQYPDRLGMVLVYGALQPRFLTATISPGKILDKAALITKSEKNILQEVNGCSVEEYFETLGLADASNMQYGMALLPFLLDYGDGMPPVSKVFIGRTPEKYAVCTGMVPTGATLHIGVFDKEDVLFTTGEVLAKVLEYASQASCLLAYSCTARSMSLGADSMAELDLIRDKIGAALPFMAAYSGGEICPTQRDDGKSITRFHNNTFILCLL